jgi:hypothetical protein
MPTRISRNVGGCCSHAPDLTILALGDRQFDPACRNLAANANARLARPEAAWFEQGSGACRGGLVAVKHDAFCQVREVLGCALTFDLDPIPLPDGLPRLCNRMLQAAVIGEEHEAFAVVIEPSSWIDAGQPDVISKRALALFARKLGEDPKRLI